MALDHAELRALCERLDSSTAIFTPDVILALLDDYDQLTKAFRNRNEVIVNLERSMEVLRAIGHELQKGCDADTARRANSAGFAVLVDR